MGLLLVKPCPELKEDYLSFYREWLESGEDMVPWVIGKDPSDFQAMIQSLIDSEQGVGLPEGWVPDSMFWLITDAQKK